MNKAESLKPRGKIDPTAGVRYLPELERKMEVTFNYLKHRSPHPVRRWTIDSLNRVLLNMLQKVHPTSILDVGSGEGFTLNFIKKNLDVKVEGVDFSPVAIKLGHALFPKIKLDVADIYRLPYKKRSIDLVLCTEVLEHLEHPREALEEIVRVAKKYVILSVPHEPFFCLKNLVIGRNIKRLGSSKGHLNLWTSWGFQKFIKKQNLKILSVRHPFPFTIVLAQKVN